LWGVSPVSSLGTGELSEMGLRSSEITRETDGFERIARYLETLHFYDSISIRYDLAYGTV
jgi:hypothetical protein